MPVLRYFLGVGSVLFALVLISDAYFAKSSNVETARAERPAIRIYSERKWPDRVVFNTTAPTASPRHGASR